MHMLNVYNLMSLDIFLHHDTITMIKVTDISITSKSFLVSIFFWGEYNHIPISKMKKFTKKTKCVLFWCKIAEVI